MATHSSILAWKIPWTKEPGWLQSMGLQRAQIRLSTQECMCVCVCVCVCIIYNFYEQITQVQTFRAQPIYISDCLLLQDIK